MDATCNLADAIEAANADSAVGGCPAGDGADTIQLEARRYALNSELGSALPVVTSSLTIRGPGATLDAESAFNVLRVSVSGTLRLEDLRLAGGIAVEGGCLQNAGEAALDRVLLDGCGAGVDVNGGNGGAIVNWDSASLHLVDSIIRDSGANRGGAIHNAGETVLTRTQLIENGAIDGSGIYNDAGAVVTLIDSVLIGNEGGGAGGGIYNAASAMLWVVGGRLDANRSGRGGALYSEGIAHVEGLTMDGNIGGSQGGGISTIGDTFITRTLVVNNIAESGDGGGIWAMSPARLSIVDSTLEGNTARQGGGVYGSATISISRMLFTDNRAGSGSAAYVNARAVIENITISNNQDLEDGAAFVARGQVTLRQATVTQNTAAGIDAGGHDGLGAITITNSIVVNQVGGRDCIGVAIISTLGSANLASDGSCPFSTPSGDASLAPLANNGGFSRSHRPDPLFSDALDGGALACGGVDQRGAQITDAGQKSRA